MYSSASASSLSLASNTTEQQLLVSSGAPVSAGSPQKVAVWGHANVTAGAAAITVTLRVRRGSGLSGAILYTSGAMNIAATQAESLAFGFDDLVPDGTGVYTLTLQQSVAQAIVGNDCAIRTSGINSLGVTA